MQDELIWPGKRWRVTAREGQSILLGSTVIAKTANEAIDKVYAAYRELWTARTSFDAEYSQGANHDR